MWMSFEFIHNPTSIQVTKLLKVRVLQYNDVYTKDLQLSPSTKSSTSSLAKSFEVILTK